MELYTLFGLLNLSEQLHIVPSNYILFRTIAYLSGFLSLHCKFLIVSPVKATTTIYNKTFKGEKFHVLSGK